MSDKITVEENIAEMNLDAAAKQAKQLTDVINSCWYTAPEQMQTRQRQVAELLNAIADSFNLNLAENIQ